MTLKKVDIAGRQRRRHRKLAVSNYLKGLAEMITNSDKSYDDLGACDSPQPIHIFADSDTRTVKVVDYAQGISRDDMEEIFTKTGAKHKTHRKGGRSLFGKGLSDTLFSPITEQGELHSIKDNLYNYIIFVRAENGNEFIDLKPDEKASDANKLIRERYHIPSGNGTCIIMKLSLNKSFPRMQTMASEIKSFYILRFINSSDNRNIVLHYKDKKGHESTIPIKYREPEDKVQVGEDLHTEFKFREYQTIKIHGKLYKTIHPLKSGEVILEKRTGGLLIFDEYKNVMDLQLFGFTENPNAKQFFGYLELKGAYEIIREFMDKEDETIITDTRDGFDQRSVFYRELRKKIDPWLAKIVTSEQSTNSEHTALSEEIIEKQKKAFNELTKIYEEINEAPPLLDDEEEPNKKGMIDPLEFSAKRVNLKVRKKYRITIKANTNIVPIGAIITFNSSIKELSFLPQDVVVKHPSAGDVFSEQITLECDKVNVDGVLNAIVNENVKTSLYVNVIPEDMHKPKNGMEFYPHKLIVPPGAKKSANLFVDLTKIPITETIKIYSSDEGVEIITEEIDIKRATRTIGAISKYVVGIRGVEDNAKCKVVAECMKYKSELEIEVREHEEEPSGSPDVFNDWEYKSLSGDWQAFPDIGSKKIQINSNHPINRQILGASKEEAEKRYMTHPHCQLLVGDLIISSFLEYAYKIANNNGNIDDPEFDINKYVRKTKMEKGLKILSSFVDFDLMSRTESISSLWIKEEEVKDSD